jgi:site-specific DNA-cytosine methylase
VVNVMEGLGYIVLTKTLTPRDYGVPHRRTRYWFLCMLVSDDRLSQQDRDRWGVMASNASQIIDELTFEAMPLDNYLMPERSQDLQLWQVARHVVAQTKRERDEKAPASAVGKTWITRYPHMKIDRFLRLLPANAA